MNVSIDTIHYFFGGGVLVIDRPSMNYVPIVHIHVYIRQCPMASWNSDWRMQGGVDLGSYQVGFVMKWLIVSPHLQIV